MLSRGNLSDVSNYDISYQLNRLDNNSVLYENIMNIDDEYIGSIGNDVYYSKSDKLYFYDVLTNKEELLE